MYARLLFSQSHATLYMLVGNVSAIALLQMAIPTVLARSFHPTSPKIDTTDMNCVVLSYAVLQMHW